MAGVGFALEPRQVPKVNTKFRKIVTQIPVPESIAILKRLRTFEPQSMGGQPLVLWDKAQGVQVWDRWGNMWLDWSSGVLVTNAGHCHPRIQKAILDQVNHGLLHNYCFPTEIRAKLVEALANVAPAGLKKVFLLTTGAETTECAIKLMRTHGIKVGGPKKITIVSFTHGFHGRTLGSQMAGGIPGLKEWIVNLDKNFVQVPFPDGFRCKDTSFDGFIKGLEKAGVKPEEVAGVIGESYLGGNASFMPREYAQQLRKWCDQHQALLTYDEVQAGFGRTGKFWAFEHYGVTPDLFCCGKGITSGLPLSAVIGRAEILDMYPPGSMTSTHTGNPVCAAAALANLQVLAEEKLTENAQRMGEYLQPELRRIGARFPQFVGTVHGKGLVASLHIVKPGTIDVDHDRAMDIVRRCIEKGLLLFAPVGTGGASVKVSPPLCVTKEQLVESISVLEEAMEESAAEFGTTTAKPAMAKA